MYRDSQYGLTIDLAGPDGNVFVLAGFAESWNKQLKKLGRPSLMKEAAKREDCYDYNDVLGIFEEWFPGMFVFLNDPRETESDT